MHGVKHGVILLNTPWAMVCFIGFQKWVTVSVREAVLSTDTDLHMRVSSHREVSQREVSEGQRAFLNSTFCPLSAKNCGVRVVLWFVLWDTGLQKYYQFGTLYWVTFNQGGSLKHWHSSVRFSSQKAVSQREQSQVPRHKSCLYHGMTLVARVTSFLPRLMMSVCRIQCHPYNSKLLPDGSRLIRIHY